jgi:hypothetical protein
MTRSSTLSPSYKLPAETNHSQLSTFPDPALSTPGESWKRATQFAELNGFTSVFATIWSEIHSYIFRCLSWLHSYHVLSLPEVSENYPNTMDHASILDFNLRAELRLFLLYCHWRTLVCSRWLIPLLTCLCLESMTPHDLSFTFVTHSEQRHTFKQSTDTSSQAAQVKEF